MITPRALAATIVALILGAAPTLAQQAGNGQEQDQEQPTTQSPAPSADKAKTNGGAAKTPATRTPQDSPFDYESSEEISKDLSVSFPVDI